MQSLCIITHVMIGASPSKALSPAKADELRLALKAEVLRDLQKEGFEVNESLKKASADLVAIRSQLDEEDDDSGGAGRRERRRHLESTSGKSKRSSVTVGKKLKRKKALQQKKAAAAPLRRRRHGGSSMPLSPTSAEKSGGRRKRTVSREGLAMANAAAAAAESGKPLPMKVYLADRPDEAMIFSIYHTNTVQELVSLAARSLDLSPSDYALRQVGPNGAADRCDPAAFPLQIVREHGADASLYRFELVPRSKSFVRFYHDTDSAKFHTIEVDDDTEAGDVLDRIGEKLRVSSDSLLLLAVTGDRRRELAEFEPVRSRRRAGGGARRRRHVCRRRASRRRRRRRRWRRRGGRRCAVAEAAAPARRWRAAPAARRRCEAVRAGAGDVARGPFWNTMLAGMGAGGAAAAARRAARAAPVARRCRRR
jgi:hypothetical protein